MNQRSVVPGLILIVVGAFLFVVQATGIGAEAVVAVIGLGFLVAYAATRHYGFLVPAGILTGLGLGIVYEVQMTSGGGAVLIGLGLGFIFIYAVDLLVERRTAGWWPVIPGGIVGTIGVLVEAERQTALADIARAWPIGLIVIGVILVIVQLRRPPQANGTLDEAPRPQ
jgi:hypothetical protein